jgi:predicted aldo/keto reductase-like oxidoreductase
MTEQANMKRRDFLKRSGAGLAGMAALGSLPLAADGQKAVGPEARKGKVITRTLGRTGIKLPVISMGVMNANNPDLVRAALDRGIVHLDTAWGYQRGQNEVMIGEVIKGRPRDSYVIATKIYEPRDRGTGLFLADAKPETFIEKFQTSLQRLQLEYVDILYLHSISNPESVTFAPYLEAMLKLKEQGKVRHLGTSTHQNEPAVIRRTADCGHYDVVLTAYNFKQQHRAEVESAMAYAAGKGLGIVGMKAVAGLVKDDKADRSRINAKAAIKWAMQNEHVHTNIPGFTTFEQLEEDLAIMEDLTLTPQELQDIEAAKVLAGVFCQQCQVCVPQCRHHIDVPALMRSYMYARGYHNFDASQSTLEQIDPSRLQCQNCSTCLVSCAMGFDVRERALAVAKVKDIPYRFIG